MALTLAEFAKEVSGWKTRIPNAAAGALYEEAQLLLVDFKKRSPRDTGRYRSKWRILKPRSLSGEIGLSIINDTSYGILMDEGAGIGEEPWKFTQNSYRSGKLYIYKGRVFAGGIDPGKTLSAGGQTGPVLMDSPRRQGQIVKRITEAVIQTLR